MASTSSSASSNSKGHFLRIDTKAARRHVVDYLHSKEKTDIALFFHQQSGQFSVMNREEMQREMRRWKPLFKEGKLTVHALNKHTYTIKGAHKPLYTFVITPVEDGLAHICPLSAALGTLVNGLTYAFTKEENRDMVYEYLAKYIPSSVE